MASSSSATVTASSDDKACRYDVFLSFCGQDTRHSFTDHLYGELKRTGIHTFRDNEGINKGEQLQPEFKKAIEESRASIVVLSKNYATSTWCLDELVLIMEQRREGNHFVLPVFYGVEPTDVRKQKGNFAIQVKPSSRWTDDNVKEWKAALMEVADLAGHVLSGPETSFLKEIIDTIYNSLDRNKVHLPSNITGITSRCKEINSWLEQPNLAVFAIYGIGGSGKTTLAKYIYNSNQRSFEYVSFVEDIDGGCKEHNGLVKLQEQLLKDISGGKKRKVPSVSRGTPMIEHVLQVNRALIVLDDVSEHSQLVALLGTRSIDNQSKVIITTRENPDTLFDSSGWSYQKHAMRLLDDIESSKLLIRHAFRSEIPKAGFEELVLRAVQYCEGNPLALEVLGSSLSKNNTISYWRSELKKLEKDMHSKIQNVLIRSYNSLPYESEKELFLHIACFFIGVDKDYVVKILEYDYSAESAIETLINRCLLSVTPNKTLKMHGLVQEMGKTIVRKQPKRSRVWVSNESYKILKNITDTESIEGLALDMKVLNKEKIALKCSELRTDALKKMHNLKLLQLNFVELNGSYDNFSEDLKWLCWLGFHLTTIPADLYMGNLVAIDMSYSKLKVFKPPAVLQSLQILNLKDSHDLTKISNISNIPHLETLILWNCHRLTNVCENLGGLSSLALLNMTGCTELFQQINPTASTSDGIVIKQPTFSFPSSLHCLFLNDCHCIDSFILSFSVHTDLQYLNLGKSLFEALPRYNHLENLQVLDLSFCSRLKSLECLPSTLAELYIYCCESLEKITFESHRFTLKEFGYEGCIHLYEVDGFIKLVPVAKLGDTDLGHMIWLKEYQNHEVCLVGDDELTEGRSRQIQMLYEFGIMSTSLPDIKDPNLTPKYRSMSSSFSFVVPSCPPDKRLKGINVTFKYAISSEDWVWFCKISTTNGVNMMYNPKVFGKPDVNKVCIWLSYWPIGNTLEIGDTVDISIVVMRGLKVYECGVSLVYSDQVILEHNMEWLEILGGDLSGFQLSTGAYYLCRRDFLELVDVGKLTPDWFRLLVGDTIDYTEVRGWRKTGQPKQVNLSNIELKTVRCIFYGPQLEDIYTIAELSKVSSRVILEKQEYSSASVKASASAKASGYDVFLSFRGEDTEQSFTNHLNKSLKQAGVSTFMYDVEMNRGEELTPEFVRAIEESRASIIVLSKNYATSTWCLDELVLILEQRRERNHFVLPVFYHVDPADVQKQKGSFEIEVKPSSRWTVDKVNQWKIALTEIANLSGFSLASGPETSMLKEIVDTIYNKLDIKNVHVPLKIIGMATRFEDISSWLEQENLEILVIYGMGGSGKTTLAKHMYYSNKKSFEYMSFIENIGSRCKTPNGLLELQEQLLKDILGRKKRKIPGISRGTLMIEEALEMNSALIVFDDIVEKSQVLALRGSRKIAARSKVIITTRENPDNLFGPYLRCQKYEMRLLNDDESSELLSSHAFGSKTPMVGFEELVLQVVQYCEGNPLALKVLGTSLADNNSILYWQSLLNLNEKDLNSQIQDTLIRSFMRLPSVSTKELFLHIACFFTGKDIDYVVKILEHDYSATSGIKTLINKCLLSISPNKKLVMHRLFQEMGKNIVRQESLKFPAKRSRVWLSSDSYEILKEGKGSETVEGLVLDMEVLRKEDFTFTPSKLKTDSFKKMDRLKYLQLNFVELDGSYKYISEALRWLSWRGFHLRTIPSDLYMGNLVAVDMRYSKLEVFDPPMVLRSLQILNLQDSHDLLEIRNISKIPCLETLILKNCYSLVYVCETIGNLRSLALLNLTGCKNLFNGKQNLVVASTSGGVATKPTFSFPMSLQQLFLDDCNLDNTDSFPLSFTSQPILQYLNLGYNPFESLPNYDHLENLRVLDLSLCSRLKSLLCLPSTLAELYVYGCELLERITFQSHRFSLQEFSYDGCINLYEVEGFIKLVPIAKLDETDLLHMNWLKEYQNHEVFLGGDDELTARRSLHIQMLYEFSIMSTSLPDIKYLDMTPEYLSLSSSLFFDVPSCPANNRLTGINVTFKYSLSGEDGVWFCKITTSNGVDLMYNPKVFGKPEFGEVCTWLSYWPIGDKLNTGDMVHVSVVVISGLEVYECGVSLVYSDQETLDSNMEWPEILGGDLSRFQLSTGAYYLCRRDFFALMDVGRLTPDWFRILVGDTIDYTEVRGWGKTGRHSQR